MGHGIGLPHSSSPFGPDYMNVWDVMSNTYFLCAAANDPIYGCMGQHTISYHKDILGWIPAEQKFIAGENINTTITLEQLALPTNNNYKMAQIPIMGSSTHFYTLEVRRLNGYDSCLPGQAVIIHDVDTLRVTPGFPTDPANVMGTDNSRDTRSPGYMWTVGETFIDPINGISVYVASETSTGFQVMITTKSMWTISGYVRMANGIGISDVTMRGLPHKTITDANGYYSDKVVDGWSGTTMPQRLNFSIEPTSLNYTNITSDHINQNYTGTYQPSGNTILLVDDDDNAPDVRSYYTDAISALGKSFDVYNTFNSNIEPSSTELTPYDTIIWFSGSERYNPGDSGDYAGPGKEEVSALKSWLDGGGCFLLSSQDFLGEFRAFMFGDYLGWNSATTDVDQTAVTGAGTVFDGLGPFTLSYPFDNKSDMISPNFDAEIAFSGDKGSAAVDKDGGSYRTVYLGFPFEAIASQADRQNVMNTFLNWCATNILSVSKVGVVMAR